MITTKIVDSDIANLKISSLPTRPTAPLSFGGKGFTAREMKEAFDKLPLFLVEKFNSLIEDIKGDVSSSISNDILTGIDTGHNLRTLFEDILNGKFSGYLKLGDKTLSIFEAEVLADVAKLKRDYEVFDPSLIQYSIDCGNAESLYNFISGGVE